MPELDFAAMERWLMAVASAHDRNVGAINYVFCDDEKILEVNRQFISHDYYTDIITFDYSRDDTVSGDVYISLDTVATNAAKYAPSYERELQRVIAHGLLHLCGIDDKGPGEREIMERHEDEALAMLN
ncbi:MAG: rRNA maturation RNase YbeY [Muribaculaceae bacterium]|nr:rRNA maturation RNase YbeY [Muribaculaceae bacterium]